MTMTSGQVWIPLASWVLAIAIGVVVLYVYFYVLHVENRENRDLIVTMTENEKLTHDKQLALQSVRVYIQARLNSVAEHRRDITKKQKDLLVFMTG